MSTGADLVAVKLMTVGDGAVGKTSLLMSFALDKFPDDYVPTVFDNYNCTMVYDQFTVNLGLWDTAGQSDYESMRPLAYPGTNVFLICFSLVNKVSADNVESYWIKEVRKHDEKVPVVLCGTKVDIYENPELMKREQERGNSGVTREYAQQLATRIGAFGYAECSGKSQKGLTQLFRKCCEAGLISQGLIKEKQQPQQASASASASLRNQGTTGENKKGCCILA